MRAQGKKEPWAHAGDSFKTAMEKQENAIAQLMQQADMSKQQTKIIAESTKEQKNGMMESADIIHHLVQIAQELESENSKIRQFSRN